MEFFNNKENDTLKFKINTEGVDVGAVDPRLIFVTNENTNYLVKGKFEGDTCIFNVPMLPEYDININGNVVFEIVSGDLYFKVWNEAFTVKTKPSVVLTDINEVKKESNTPTITVNSIKVEPIIEPAKKVVKESKATPKPPKPTIAEVKKKVANDLKLNEEEEDIFLNLDSILKD